MYQQNPMQMVQAFNQFRQMFNGDPRQQVQDLLNSGQMSQQQFNQLQSQATEFMRMMQSINVK